MTILRSLNVICVLSTNSERDSSATTLSTRGLAQILQSSRIKRKSVTRSVRIPDEWQDTRESMYFDRAARRFAGDAASRCSRTGCGQSDDRSLHSISRSQRHGRERNASGSVLSAGVLPRRVVGAVYDELSRQAHAGWHQHDHGEPDTHSRRVAVAWDRLRRGCRGRRAGWDGQERTVEYVLVYPGDVQLCVVADVAKCGGCRWNRKHHRDDDERVRMDRRE